MIDSWEVLDRAANIVEVGGLLYLIYKNRDKVERLAVKARIMKPLHLQARALPLSGVIASRSSVRATPQVSRQSLPAWEELLWWYLRTRSSLSYRTSLGGTPRRLDRG
jgi:hypothetical protein